MQGPLNARSAAVAAGLCASALLLWPAQVSACDSVDPRDTVFMFNYGGADVGEARNQHSQFQSAIHDKARQWVDELKRLSAGLDYLDGFHVEKPGEDTLAGNPARTRQFFAGTRALELLSGVVTKDSGRDSYSVRSRIFVGELRGSLGEESVVVSMPISAAQFGSMMDSHSVVTFYALAMDARRRKCDRAVSIALLSALMEKVRDLGRHGPLDPDLKLVQEAADRELKALTR